MRRLARLAVAAVVLAACGGGSTGTTERGDTAVVRVETRGGFTANASGRARLPPLSVFGDGRVIVTGPTTLEFPGPALPNLQEFHLTRVGLARIVDDARATGLLDDARPDYGDVTVTDQPTTTITVRAGGRRGHVDVYGLEFGNGLTAQQRENRNRLKRFIQRAGDAAALGGDVAPGSARRYEPATLAVLVRPADTTSGDVHAWPLGDLAGVDCVVLTGADAITVLGAARTAHTGDVWEAAGATYSVTFRPLFPDERACADLGPNR